MTHREMIKQMMRFYHEQPIGLRIQIHDAAIDTGVPLEELVYEFLEAYFQMDDNRPLFLSTFVPNQANH